MQTRVANHAEQNSPLMLSAHSVKNGMLNKLSVQLQKFNARATQRFAVDQKRKQNEWRALRQLDGVAPMSVDAE